MLCIVDLTHLLSWKDTIDILPTEFSTPMFWSNEELEELKGTGVVGMVSSLVGRNSSSTPFCAANTREGIAHP
jgi:hypothetical protein